MSSTYTAMIWRDGDITVRGGHGCGGFVFRDDGNASRTIRVTFSGRLADMIREWRARWDYPANGEPAAFDLAGVIADWFEENPHEMSGTEEQKARVVKYFRAVFTQRKAYPA